MDGSFETAYASPPVKTEDRWGREDMMGGRQGPIDSYRVRRSPGKTPDAENMIPLHSYHPPSSHSSSPVFVTGTVLQNMTLLHQKMSSALFVNNQILT